MTTCGALVRADLPALRGATQELDHGGGGLLRGLLRHVVADERDHLPLVGAGEEAGLRVRARGDANTIALSPCSTMVGTVIDGRAASRCSTPSSAGSPGA